MGDYKSKGCIKSSVFKLRPIKIEKLRTELPPYEKKGRVIPVTGITPKFMPILMTDWKMIITAVEVTKIEAGRYF